MDSQDAKHVIAINDQRVAFYKLGHGVPLLFLHGGRVRARTFRRAIERLAESYTVIAPDIPGYGDSETPHGIWSFIEYADFFDAFLRKIDVTGAIVMGYSMGGGIAFNLAARSDRVNRLVLIDAAGLPAPGAKQNHHDLRRLCFYITHPAYIASLLVLAAGFLQFAWKHRGDWGHMKAIRRRCFETSYQAALAAIHTPTDIIWGRDDWIFPVATAERFQESISHAHLQVVPGNHDWLLYQPLQIDDIVLRYTGKS